MGHEFLGIVEEIGAEVSGFQTGDLVVAPFLWCDNTRDFCRAGLTVPADMAAVGAPRRRWRAGRGGPGAARRRHFGEVAGRTDSVLLPRCSACPT